MLYLLPDKLSPGDIIIDTNWNRKYFVGTLPGIIVSIKPDSKVFHADYKVKYLTADGILINSSLYKFLVVHHYKRM